MKRLFLAAFFASAAMFNVAVSTADVVDGGFEDVAAPDVNGDVLLNNWNHWTFDSDALDGGTPWSRTEDASATTWASGSSPPSGRFLSLGSGNTGTSGAWQETGVDAGVTYVLSADSGADAWWLPTGNMLLEWYDASGASLGIDQRNTIDPAVYGQNFDIAHPWETFTLTATAPAGAASAKVEFSAIGGSGGNATGSLGFDNISFVAVPEPSSAAIVLVGGVFAAIRRRRVAG